MTHQGYVQPVAQASWLQVLCLTYSIIFSNKNWLHLERKLLQSHHEEWSLGESSFKKNTVTGFFSELFWPNASFLLLPLLCICAQSLLKTPMVCYQSPSHSNVAFCLEVGSNPTCVQHPSVVWYDIWGKHPNIQAALLHYRNLPQSHMMVAFSSSISSRRRLVSSCIWALSCCSLAIYSTVFWSVSAWLI